MATYLPGFLKRPPVAAEGIHVQPEVQPLGERQVRGQMSRKARRHLGVLMGGIVAAWAGSRWVLSPRPPTGWRIPVAGA